tara:strand:- start:1068 stop:1319 length:252 start_codon:yes stop_codon:yes gene_type:complete
MARNNWKLILKDEVSNETRTMKIYSEVKRRFPHLWEEAQQLTGTGEVATLDSIVLRTIRENLDKHNIVELAKIAGENYILRDY